MRQGFDVTPKFKKFSTHMTRKLSLTLCLVAAIAIVAAPIKTKQIMTSDSHNIMVISDIHLLAPELHDDGTAAQRLAQADMKMTLMSDLIMQRVVEQAIERHTQLLLITGDLTYNGARASHLRLTTHLSQLQQHGVRVLVIPGNHDINCPNARSYHGTKAERVETVTRDEFAQIYADYGYSGHTQRDTASLSYACEPLPGVVVLGIDSNRDEENRLQQRGDSADVYHNGGRVKPATLQWLRDQATEARSQGKCVIAMMHHHLLEHIDGEARFLPNYIVANHDQVTQAMAECGVRVVLTGHLHVTDAVTDGTLTDVATGSASMWPMPVRWMTLDTEQGTLQVSTTGIELPEAIQQQARERVERSTPILAGVIANRLWARMQPQLDKMKQMLAMQGVDTAAMPQRAAQATALMLRHMQQPLTQSLLAVTHGAEDPQQAPAIIGAIKQGVLGMVQETMPGQAQLMGPFLLENLWPRVEPMVRSALEDRNRVGTPQESITPDHWLTIPL